MDEKDFRRRSNLTGLFYDYFDTVKIRNMNQAAAYMEADVFPIDIRPARDPETGKRIITFYFNKEESKEVFDLWCRRELK